MVSFKSASSAVACAVRVQKTFLDYNENHPEGKIQVRIGISAGEPVEEDNRLFGSTVQLGGYLQCNASQRRVGLGPLVQLLFQPVFLEGKVRLQNGLELGVPCTVDKGQNGMAKRSLLNFGIVGGSL